MTTPAPRPSSARLLSLIGKLLFIGFFVCAIGGVMVMIARSASEGLSTIDAWATRVRQGAEVSEALAGSERDAVLAAVRGSKTTSYVNFLSQSDTSCFWVRLDDAPGSELKVLLVERNGVQDVAAVGLSRECECPDDDAPCHLP